MSDYILTKSFRLDEEHAEPIPVGKAIAALQALNQKLEESLPRQQAVPAYTSTAAKPGSHQD